MAEKLPEFERTTAIEGTINVPEWGKELTHFAQSTNMLGDIGAMVAQNASQEIARRKGTELGQNPQGDMLPPITDFDKTLKESYETQAQATLGLQGNRLLADADIQVHSANRITPGLIANTNKQVATGLSKIAEQAPSNVKGKLQAQFGAQLLQQDHQYRTKMISQEREDQRNTLIASGRENARVAYDLAMGGDYEAAKRLADDTKKANDVAVKNGLFNKQEAVTNSDPVRKNALAGIYTAGLMQARKDGKEAEYLKKFGEEKPSDIKSYDDYEFVGTSLLQNVSRMDNLSQRNAQLKIAQFQLAQTEDITGITGEMIADLEANTTPAQFAQTMTSFVKAKQAADKAAASANELAADFTNIEKFPLFSSDQKNAAFKLMTADFMKKREAMGAPVSEQEAQAQVAMSAGGTIPDFVAVQNNKLRSTNPIAIQEASAAVRYMTKADKGQNLQGLTDEAKAMMYAYDSMKDVYDPIEAAQKAHEKVYNKSQEQRDANNDAYVDFKSSLRSKGMSTAQHALKVADIPKDAVTNIPMVSDYAAQTFESYFKLTNGDQETAEKMTKDHMSQVYGMTTVNGRKEYAYLPIEKVLGLQENANGAIHDDLTGQVFKQFSRSREMYDAGRSDWYWEIKPRIDAADAIKARTEINEAKEEQRANPVSEGIFDVKGIRQKKVANQKTLNEFNNGMPPVAIQVFRDGTRKQFELSIQADAGLTRTSNSNAPIAGGYVVNLKTANSTMPISDPITGTITYIPNADRIRRIQLATTQLSTGEQVDNLMKQAIMILGKQKVLGPIYGK